MPQDTPPSDFKPGLLPRGTEFGKLRGAPTFREAINVMPRSEQEELMSQSTGMRRLVGDIFNQDGVGSCARESSEQGLSICRLFSGQKHVLFNPWFGYGRPAAYGYPAGTSGGRDGGSTIDGNIADLMEIGACPASVFPRYDTEKRIINVWNSKPPLIAFEEASKYRLLEVFDLNTVDQMRTALLLNMPVIYGSDGHAKCYVKILNMQTGLYANSWNESWGDEGFGTERFDNVWIQYGAFALRSVSDTDIIPTRQ